MKEFLYSILAVLIIQLLVNSCANPISPTGGPKDTIPPTLIRSNPLDQALNFKDQTITLEFDELVIADKLKQSLIVTPNSDLKFKTYIKKNLVTLKFEEPFADSTTYTLNFFDGITDITEKNPAENLILAFSTTSYIDSLSIYGTVKDLFTGKRLDKYTVGIYRITDSLNYKDTQPTYFSTTDEFGVFKIQNIKAGKYKLFSFKDENRNLLFDATQESYAFKADTIELKQSVEDSIRLSALSINAAELDFISARPSGRYFEIRYTKPITTYELKTIDSLYLPSRIVGEKETIRIYPKDFMGDSTLTYVTVTDSLKNKRIDTVFVKFRESSRKPDDYKVSLLPKNGQAILSEQNFKLEFNKPTNVLDSNFAIIKIDTLWTIPITTYGYRFNYNKNTFSFKSPINKTLYKNTIDSLKNLYPIDTVNIDSTHLYYQQILNTLNPDRIELTIKPNSFISAEQDSSKSIKNTYSFSSNSEFGLIRVNLISDKQSYTVQLISNNEVVQQQQNCSNCTFKNLKPGEYSVRILHDENQDGLWTYGNILQSIEPERIYHFNEKTNLRANWEVELEYEF